MSRVFCLTGKSCSGKDTLYRALLQAHPEELAPLVPYTTRPRRAGEEEGVDYHFVDDARLQAYLAEGRVIELRQYHTTRGVWSYFTLDFPPDRGRDFLTVTTLEGVRALRDRLGTEAVRPVYLFTDDRTRLLRHINRESRQARPDYNEVCRRFLADQEDFSEEKLAALGPVGRIDTGEPLPRCVAAWEALRREGR